LKNKGNNIRIIASEGDHQLGGKDFDDAIIKICAKTFEQEHGFNPTDDLIDFQQLRKDSENAKKELSIRKRNFSNCQVERIPKSSRNYSGSI